MLPLFKCDGVILGDLEKINIGEYLFLQDTSIFLRNDSYPYGYFGLMLYTAYTYIRTQ
jgi:hypothetical protein